MQRRGGLLDQGISSRANIPVALEPPPPPSAQPLHHEAKDNTDGVDDAKQQQQPNARGDAPLFELPLAVVEGRERRPNGLAAGEECKQ